jgi:four helix bundle protein
MKWETPHMKRETPNTERRTPNIEWCGPEFRVSEESQAGYGNKHRQKFDLEDRLLNFAVEIIELTEALPNTRAANHVAGQLLRSGTSPYGNHGEVEAAESLNDFIHKLKVCLKELRETRRWLRLVARLKDQKAAAKFAMVPERSRRTHSNFQSQHQHGGGKARMSRTLSFDVRCSAFGVRCLPLVSSLRFGRCPLLPSRFNVRCSVFDVRCCAPIP